MDRNYANLLIDYYGNLLTEHQLEVLNDYFMDDLSMNEIADKYNVSKAAISDLINRSITILENYEFKLNDISKDSKISSIIEEMSNTDNSYIKEFANKLNKIIRS